MENAACILCRSIRGLVDLYANHRAQPLCYFLIGERLIIQHIISVLLFHCRHLRTCVKVVARCFLGYRNRKGQGLESTDLRDGHRVLSGLEAVRGQLQQSILYRKAVLARQDLLMLVGLGVVAMLHGYLGIRTDRIQIILCVSAQVNAVMIGLCRIDHPLCTVKCRRFLALRHGLLPRHHGIAAGRIYQHTHWCIAFQRNQNLVLFLAERARAEIEYGLVFRSDIPAKHIVTQGVRLGLFQISDSVDRNLILFQSPFAVFFIQRQLIGSFRCNADTADLGNTKRGQFPAQFHLGRTHAVILGSHLNGVSSVLCKRTRQNADRRVVVDRVPIVAGIAALILGQQLGRHTLGIDDLNLLQVLHKVTLGVCESDKDRLIMSKRRLLGFQLDILFQILAINNVEIGSAVAIGIQRNALGTKIEVRQRATINGQAIVVDLVVSALFQTRELMTIDHNPRDCLEIGRIVARQNHIFSFGDELVRSFLSLCVDQFHGRRQFTQINAAHLGLTEQTVFQHFLDGIRITAAQFSVLCVLLKGQVLAVFLGTLHGIHIIHPVVSMPSVCIIHCIPLILHQKTPASVDAVALRRAQSQLAENLRIAQQVFIKNNVCRHDHAAFTAAAAAAARRAADCVNTHRLGLGLCCRRSVYGVSRNGLSLFHLERTRHILKTGRMHGQGIGAELCKQRFLLIIII